MNIQTKYHGEVNISELDTWTFDNGIPGFLDEKEYVILPFPDSDVFSILQSVQTPALGFIIANPFTYFKDYDFKIDENTLVQLEIKQESDVLVYTILTVQESFEKTTTNLQAPLILNIRNKKAKQMILIDTSYKTKEPIIQSKAIKG